MPEERLDVIIFGATSVTGKYTVKEVQRLAKEKNFTWGIADKSEESLKAILDEFAPESNDIRVITADVKNDESLIKMTIQTKILVNCCGPYRFYGEPVIKACIATRTHQVDLSGEPQYTETIQLLYDKSAKEAGIYIISSCGIECVPFDLGVIYAQNQFNGEINSIEAYFKAWTTPGMDNVLFHYDRWLACVYNVAHRNELMDIREKFNNDLITRLEPKLKSKGFVHWDEITQSWARLMISPNVRVGERTQTFMYQNYNQRPIQLQTYLTFRSRWHVLKGFSIGAAAYLFTSFTFGRSLLLKYPKFFSRGVASHEGPSQEAMENTHYNVTFHAKGWSKKIRNDSSIKRKDKLDKEMVIRVSGINPEYGMSNIAVLLSALMILRESHNIPFGGGVLTPGAAFGKTSMIQELIQHGIQFEILRVSS